MRLKNTKGFKYMKKEYQRIIIELIEVNDEGEEKVIDDYAVFAEQSISPLLSLVLREFICLTSYTSFIDWMEQLFDRSLKKSYDSEFIDEEYLPKGYRRRFIDDDSGDLKIYQVENKTDFLINEFGDDVWYLYRQARIFNFLLIGMDDEELHGALCEV
jgi:hypothetical protein